MARRAGPDIIHRYKGNPLISIDDLPFLCSDIWNTAVVRFQGECLLLITVETLEGQGSIFTARGADLGEFAIDAEPFMTGSEHGPFAPYERFGIRDPRITEIDGTYYITYVANSEHGHRIGLARTKDFRSVERMGLVSEADNKNGALFPQKVNGRYAMLQRPYEGGSIWIAYSDDLTYWGASTVVMTPRDGFWDATRIGAAGPPIEIDQGWLLIYYGQKGTSAGPLVRLGAAILDRHNPARVIARSNIPILSPRENYERIGDVGNVVFSCGALLEDDGQVKIYYGAANSCICLGTGSLSDITTVCRQSEQEF